MSVNREEYRNTESSSTDRENYPFEELDLNNYSIECIRTGMMSHTLQKVEAILDNPEEDRNYELTVTEHPDGGSWVRVSPTETGEVYGGRFDTFSTEEDDLEEILDGEKLGRDY